MRIDEVVWLAEIVDKLERKHGVSVDEAEEVLHGAGRTFRVEDGLVPGEDLFAVYGQTSNGRYLIVFYIAKSSSRALVISARDQSLKERQRYGRK